MNVIGADVQAVQEIRLGNFPKNGHLELMWALTKQHTSK